MIQSLLIETAIDLIRFKEMFLLFARDGEGAFSEAKSLMSSLAFSDEETKDAHSVNFLFNGRNFPL